MVNSHFQVQIFSGGAGEAKLQGRGDTMNTQPQQGQRTRVRQGLPSTLLQRRIPTRAAPQGWTLLEMLCAMALLGLLLSQAAPALGDLRARQQLQAQAQALFDTLHWARSEALVRQLRVSVCPALDDHSCDAQGRWEMGWLVFEDREVNGRRDAHELLLQHHAGPQGQMAAVRWRGNSGVATHITYTALGRSQLPSGAFQAGTLRLCRGADTPGWALVLNALGRVRMERLPAADCQLAAD